MKHSSDSVESKNTTFFFLAQCSCSPYCKDWPRYLVKLETPFIFIALCLWEIQYEWWIIFFVLSGHPPLHKQQNSEDRRLQRRRNLQSVSYILLQVLSHIGFYINVDLHEFWVLCEDKFVTILHLNRRVRIPWSPSIPIGLSFI